MIKELDKNTFDELSKNFDGLTFYQNSNWAKVKTFTGWKGIYLGLYKNDKLEALGLFLLKKMPIINYYLAYSPRGFLTNYNDLQLLEELNKELIPYLRKLNIFELIIDPYLPLNKRDIDGQIVEDSFDNTVVVDKLISLGYKHNGYNLYYENLQPRWLFRLPLKDKTYDELLAGFKKEAKRRTLKKDFLAINVRELRRDEIKTYKSLMEMTAKRKGFIDRPLSYYEQMYDCLHDDGILRYMVAEMDIDKCKDNVNKEIKRLNEKIEKLSIHPESNAGKIKEENVTLNGNLKLLEQLDNCEKKNGKFAPLSVVCLLSHGKEAIMLLAGNDEEYLQHFNTSNIIVAELIRMTKEEGYDYYNFYGITGNFDPKSESYGLYTYKKQYGGEVLELIGQFSYTINGFVKKMYDIILKVYKLTKRH